MKKKKRNEKTDVKAYYVTVWCDGFIGAKSKKEAIEMLKSCRVCDLRNLHIQQKTVEISAQREEWYDELLTI